MVYKRLGDELGLTPTEIEDAVTSIDIGEDIDVEDGISDKTPASENYEDDELEAKITQLLQLVELLTQLLALQLQN